MRYRRDDLSSLGGSFNLSLLPRQIANRLALNLSLSSSGRCSRCDRRTDQGFGISHSQLIASTKSSSRFFAIFVSANSLPCFIDFAHADSTFELQLSNDVVPCNSHSFTLHHFLLTSNATRIDPSSPDSHSAFSPSQLYHVRISSQALAQTRNQEASEETDGEKSELLDTRSKCEGSASWGRLCRDTVE